MSKNNADKLYNLTKSNQINRDDLLRECLKRLENINPDILEEIALRKGFVLKSAENEDEIFEEQIKHLDAKQRIIEKVLRRYGEY